MKTTDTPIFTRNKLQVQSSVIINRTPDVVYRFWKELSNLHLVMYHLKSVRVLNSTNSEWIVKIPGGIGDLKWEAEIIKDEPNKSIEWVTLPETSVEHSGRLTFTAIDKQKTKVEIEISYYTLMNIEGTQIPTLLNKVVEEVVAHELQGLKSYLESTLTH